MSDDVLVNVEGVSKKFCRSLKRSLWFGVQDVSAELFGRKDQHETLRRDEFWAVDDVWFELRRGECLGLIGPNGAGKSTLLKMLNGLVKPDCGRITMRGRVGALIELGAGFNPVLTARENIYVNGSVLGLSRKEIDSRFDAIIDFAELADFVDSPVQNFSSGMKVRLGFAVAAQVQPDVLMIDEVLAVGDVGFRAKCMNSISAMMSNAAVVFVSHNMTDVARISTRIAVLQQGRNLGSGLSVQAGIEEYHRLSAPMLSGRELGNRKARLLNFEIRNADGELTDSVNYLDTINAHFSLAIDKRLRGVVVNLSFLDERLQAVATASSRVAHFAIDGDEQPVHLRVQIPKFALNDGVYQVELAVHDRKMREVLFKKTNVGRLLVSSDIVSHAPVKLQTNWQVTPAASGTRYTK